ncbi:SDR family NAD(P)-dependent oxidoreductase [Spirobacillus cienkowskii]|uniref:SDR family NAD(P)-dependent oxidoreductase n=1 Tax=Spirobacillus cienkowskii TaxID=495820 RepID=UPI0030D10FF7
MKIKSTWSALPYPRNWEFTGHCDEGQDTLIAGKNDDKVVKGGPNPKELLLQSMTTCTGIDVVSILQKMRQPLEFFEVECDARMSEHHPIVFTHCNLNYYVKGKDLSVERVALAVKLSFTEYCGVSTMIKRSGCHVEPKLFVNDQEVSIWDPEDALHEKLTKWLADVASQAPRGVALVVGSSRGIGLSLSKQLIKQGYAVIATARGKGTFEEKEIFGSLTLDVTKINSIQFIKQLFEKLNLKINLYVHNAGVLSTVHELSESYALSLGANEIQHVFNTNLIGLVEFNNAILPFMAPHSVIAMVSSIMGHSSYTDYSYAAYRLSKRSVMHYAQLAALQCRAENKDIAIISLHPGSVKTDMNINGKITAEQSAKNIGELLSKENSQLVKENSGGFCNYNENLSKWEFV